ncbi:MAG: hypothetical protein RLZZ306_692, partial [Bacteroidota bacterium]
MKKIYKILVISTLIFSSWACDEIKEVPEPKILTAETPLNNTKIIYTQSNNFVAFDTKNLLNKTQGFTSLKVESTPQFGKISFNKNGLLIYKADSTKAEATEILIYKALNADSKKDKRDTLKIIITTDFAKTPCNAGAIPDNFPVKINTPTILNVLKNDRFCSSILDSTTLEVIEKPLLGTAVVENNRIKYTPKTGSEADDFFLYKVCTGGTSPVCLIAGVRIDVQGNACRSFLFPDFLVVNKSNANVQIIKVLDNDKICDNYDKKSLKISVQPRFGKAIVNNNQEIEYTQTANKPALDELEYSIFDKDGKNQLRMLVGVVIREIPVCKPDAKNGEMELSVTQTKDKEIEIPYVLHVAPCVEIKEVNFEKQTDFGTLRVDGKKIFYKLKSSTDLKERNDQFKFIVTTANGETLKANFT